MNAQANPQTRGHDTAMAELYRDDPTLAAAVLDEILADGDQAELLVMLRQLALASGGIHVAAQRSGLNRTQLYKMLSEKGNPALSSLAAVLRGMGMRLSVTALEAKAAG
ncbi:hypothetical protein FACS1894185_6530 [Betaproteobacteria bacterium]|nr:hypothetical protein FACS1894185_6530 [Betaproteobacteria bacterium]